MIDLDPSPSPSPLLTVPGRDLRVLVSGGSSGIGAAVVELFAHHGVSAVILDRHPPESGADGPFVQCDLMSSSATEAAVARAIELLDGLDVVVNCAGVGAQGDISTVTAEDWSVVLGVNVIGAAAVIQFAWSALIDSPYGAIVNISSVAAITGLVNRVAYTASKGAVSAMTRALAADGIAHGIRANSVCPGTTDTPWVRRLLAQASDPDGEMSALQARQPHGRLVRPQEVAEAVLMLASPLTASITGTEVVVDGGLSSLCLPK